MKIPMKIPMSIQRLTILLLTSLASLAMTGSANADASKPAPLHVGGGLSHPPHIMILQALYPNIVYDKSAPDTRYTSLDVYTLDPVEPKSPVMVFVHGGGLRVGDKASSKDLDPKPEFFNSKLGYIFVSVNYRLLPGGRYPTNVQDVANALAWVHSNIADYGGDPAQIFLMGHSAGAGLVTQVATDGAFLKKAGKDLRILKGVISNEGSSYDLTAEGFDVKRAEASYGPDWRKASAISYVAKGRDIPPFLLIHVKNGTGISAGSQKQANDFAAALRAAGIRADLLPVDHVEHFGANERLGEPGDVITATVEAFLSSISTSKRPIGWTTGRPL
jgi:acetyl esterase/lipase